MERLSLLVVPCEILSIHVLGNTDDRPISVRLMPLMKCRIHRLSVTLEGASIFQRQGANRQRKQITMLRIVKLLDTNNPVDSLYCSSSSPIRRNESSLSSLSYPTIPMLLNHPHSPSWHGWHTSTIPLKGLNSIWT